MFQGFFTGLMGSAGVDLDRAIGTVKYFPQRLSAIQTPFDNYIIPHSSMSLEYENLKREFRDKHHRDPFIRYEMGKEVWK